MENFKAEIAKPRMVALYASMDLNGYFSVFEVTYKSYDENYNALPAGEKRENLRTSFVRISEPVEVNFTSVSNDEVIQKAVATLDAEERQAIDDLNKKVASIRERKQQLLAITFQPNVA